MVQLPTLIGMEFTSGAQKIMRHSVSVQHNGCARIGRASHVTLTRTDRHEVFSLGHFYHDPSRSAPFNSKKRQAAYFASDTHAQLTSHEVPSTLT